MYGGKYMFLTVIKWRLAEIMARHKIKGNELADQLKVRPNTVSNLKNAPTMPRLDGDRLNELCVALTLLANESITPNHLIEYSIESELMLNE
jgi:putative transcriptional regulator